MSVLALWLSKALWGWDGLVLMLGLILGIGLLVALHSFEETTPGHPYYGWAHCTQTALAAYLDTSQDTVARYTNLLALCGLVRVEEVETARGKQKLYRVARGRVTLRPERVDLE